MFKQDTISITLIVIAVSISIYLTTFAPTILYLTPAIVLISGLVLQIYTVGLRPPEDEIFTERGARNVFFSILVVLGISFGGLLSSQISMFSMLSFFDASLVGVLMAVAEEQFFRGFFTAWLIQKCGPPMGILFGSILFASFHIGVYGLEFSSFTYIIIAGALLGLVCYHTGRLSPAMLAHVAVNYMVLSGVA